MFDYSSVQVETLVEKEVFKYPAAVLFMFCQRGLCSAQCFCTRVS